MNKLDDKVIVDRDVFVGILDMARRGLDSGFFGEVYHQDFAKGEQALAADLTGWAAVPVMLTGSMFNNSRVDSPFMVTAPIGVVAQHKWLSILNASPPLPGGGE